MRTNWRPASSAISRPPPAQPTGRPRDARARPCGIGAPTLPASASQRPRHANAYRKPRPAKRLNAGLRFSRTRASRLTRSSGRARRISTFSSENRIRGGNFDYDLRVTESESRRKCSAKCGIMPQPRREIVLGMAVQPCRQVPDPATMPPAKLSARRDPLRISFNLTLGGALSRMMGNEAEPWRRK